MDFQHVVLYVVFPVIGACLMYMGMEWEFNRKMEIRRNNTMELLRIFAKDDIVEDDDTYDEDEPEDRI